MQPFNIVMIYCWDKKLHVSWCEFMHVLDCEKFLLTCLGSVAVAKNDTINNKFTLMSTQLYFFLLQKRKCPFCRCTELLVNFLHRIQNSGFRSVFEDKELYSRGKLDKIAKCSNKIFSIKDWSISDQKKSL